MKRIFVSYSHKDSDAVNKIAERISSNGFNLWIDKNNLKGGEGWREELVNAIDASTNYIIFLSNNSIESESVQKELNIASDLDKKIVPVMLEEIEIPNSMRFSLANIQWIDCKKDLDTCSDEIAFSLGESFAYYSDEDFEIMAKQISPKLYSLLPAKFVFFTQIAVQSDQRVIDKLEKLLLEDQNKDEWILYYLVGDKYQKVGRYSDGLRVLQMANKVKANDLRSTYALATAYNLYTRAAWGDKEKEIEAFNLLFQEILKHVDSGINPQKAKSELAKINFVVETSAAQAIKYFEKCLEMNPDTFSRKQIQIDLETLFKRFPELRM